MLSVSISRAFLRMKACADPLLPNCAANEAHLQELISTFSVPVQCQNQYDGMHCFVVMQRSREAWPWFKDRDAPLIECYFPLKASLPYSTEYGHAPFCPPLFPFPLLMTPFNYTLR